MENILTFVAFYFGIGLVFGVYEAAKFKEHHKEYATFAGIFGQGFACACLWPWVIIYRGGRF